jgi:hypothetical protein
MMTGVLNLSLSTIGLGENAFLVSVSNLLDVWLAHHVQAHPLHRESLLATACMMTQEQLILIYEARKVRAFVLFI